MNLRCPSLANLQKVAQSGRPKGHMLLIHLHLLAKVCKEHAQSFADDALCSRYLRAPEEVPTSTAVGAASPSAQGQATTSTLHASCRLSSKGAAAPPSPPPPYLLSTCTAKLVLRLRFYQDYAVPDKVLVA